MHNKMYDDISTNEIPKKENSDQEIIVVNKSGLINDISDLLTLCCATGFIFGVIIGAVITQLIIRF